MWGGIIAVVGCAKKVINGKIKKKILKGVK